MDLIVEDLIYAKDNLPTEQTSAKGAPTKATAAAFLAKVYLFRKEWANAKPPPGMLF